MVTFFHACLFTSIKYYARLCDLKTQKIPCHLWRIKIFFPAYTHRIVFGFWQFSQPTWKSGKSVNYQRIWKWALFYWKISELSGNSGWISGKSGKIDIFRQKYFSVVNFLFALFSVIPIFIFWNITLTLSCYEYYVASRVVVFLRYFEYSSITCLIVAWCIIASRIIKVTNLHRHLKKSGFREVNFNAVALQISKEFGYRYYSAVTS